MEKSGEYAVLIGDQWQGFGLGLKLMASLIEIAKDKHLEKIYGYVMANNYKMQNLCNRIGFKAEKVDDDTLIMSLSIVIDYTSRIFCHEFRTNQIFLSEQENGLE